MFLAVFQPINAQAQALNISDGQTHKLSDNTNLSTSQDAKDGFGVLVSNPGSVVEANNLTISTIGQGAAGIKLESSGKAILKGGAIETTTTTGNSSSAAYGVWVTGKGLAELDGTSITTSGKFAYGLYAHTVPETEKMGILAHDVIVNTSGESAHGAVAASKGALQLSGATITTTGKGARAVSAQRGTISVSDSLLITKGENAPGMMVTGDGSGVGSNAAVSGTRIETHGSKSVGIKVDAASTLEFRNGQIETKALDGNGSQSAYGIWVTGGGSAELESTTVKTAGAHAYGLFSTYKPTVGSVSISATETSVETSGQNAHGVFAHMDSAIDFSSGKIVTSGNNATGARAEAGGTLSIWGTTIRTSGSNAAGLMATANASGKGAMAQAHNVNIVTDGDVSAGVAAFQRGSTVTLDGGSVETHGEKSAGLSAEATAQVRADGVRVSTSGATAYGVRSYYKGKVSLLNTYVSTHGAGASGLYANGDSSIDATASLISTEGPAAAGVELLASSTVQLNQSWVAASGAGSHGILGTSGNNAVNMIDSVVLASGSALEVAEAGLVQASLRHSALVGINGVALNVNGSLDLVVDDRSYIFGAALKNPATGTSRLALSGDSRWDVAGTSSLTSLTNVGSHINFTPPANPTDATQYKTLTVGNYVGNGGSIALNTWLEGSGSASDQLIVDGGRASGTTAIIVRNTGGGGALTTGDGIMIVDAINGGVTDEGAFSLAGRVAAGAYEYRLYRGGSENPDAWYLRSTREEPDYRVEVPLNMALPSLANRFGLAMLGTYHDRSGEDYIDLASTRQYDGAAWGRTFGEKGSVGKSGYDALITRGPSYDYDIAGVQVGRDLYRRVQPSGIRDIAGVYLGAATSSADVKAPLSGRAGTASMSGLSLGGYWTRKSASGAYLDGVVQGTYHPEVKASSAGGERSTTRGYSGIASLEVGYPISLAQRWALEPQAQMIYQYVTINRTKDSFGRIKFDDTHAGYARIGARLVHQADNRKGKGATVWLRANLWQQFGPDNRTTFSNLAGEHSVVMKTRSSNTWVQMGLGVSGQLSERVSGFIAADYNRSLGGYAGSGVSGRLGIRILW
ncbi:MAG: autotransporter outer membrane beta-barrel domain-containing protein [Castellaniella sp.]|uniref:autotransporter family protein n=1 Tax=Castellaniella sp. TaxID=1955812 RepID=UPI002A3690C0|nr:autotransporter outer membrane beta-barrel domain-containing protein [Castellaniella sp.]MDY0309079.1 autotransporter outer membrane beta-barrel domain-containing protein [Castellaniella sp.]